LVVDHIRTLPDEFHKADRSIANVFHTGGNDLSLEGEWRWLFSGQKIDMDPKLWWKEKGEPNGGRAENCQILFTYSADTKGPIKMGNWVCDLDWHYICELY